jgi:hypothetical protein
MTVDDFIIAGRAALERWPDTDLFLVPSKGFDSRSATSMARRLTKWPRVLDALSGLSRKTAPSMPR